MALRFAAVTMALVLALTAAALPLHAQDIATVNDTARILGGMQPTQGSAAASVASSPGFAAHARDMESAWAKLESGRLAPMRAWSSANLPGRGSSRPIYYPFSGADFLHLYTYYPSSSTYVMCGLEPVGSVPALAGLPADQLAGGLAQVRGSLNSLLRYSYFMTKEMRSDFGGNRFGGVTPVLLLMLARNGCTITDLSYVYLGANGAVGPSARGKGNGVRIVFRGRGGTQELLYFSYNLSDGGATSYINLMRARGQGQTYLKAASYLMHGGGFTRIRDGILANSYTILQDDSGIPLRYFTAKPVWKLQFFGNYTKPIPLFANYYQDDLRSVYTSGTAGPIRELTFGIGYFFWGNQSNLMLATKTGNAPSYVPASPAAPASQKPAKPGQAPAATTQQPPAKPGFQLFRLQPDEPEPAPPTAKPKRRVRDMDLE